MFTKKFRKAIAVFLLIVWVNSVITPCVSYALTSGPTAPEATSFEPVDTTDMVDLKTGDFTYNVPLIEVPGPAGSYPLSLSYHAGIQPDQEASWVGLGFTLNPGTISRLVNGYPDDHDNVTNVDRSFWEGGETETYTVGLSVGIGNVATVSGGLVFCQDTYRGSGVGGYVGGGVMINGVGANMTIGLSPYGQAYASGGLSLGLSHATQQGMTMNGSIGIGVNADSKLYAGVSGGINAGTGRDQTSLLDASISTASSKPSLSVGGLTAGIHNSKSNKVSIYSNGGVIDIPVYVGVNLRLGREYQRYWIDEKEHAHTFGSLYYDDVQPNTVSAFDTYEILDMSLDMADHDNEDKVLGGGFPDVDHYTVTGQGIAGNIRPYHYQQNLYRQDKVDGAKDDEMLVKSYPLSTNSNRKPVTFRFVNDFSNRYEYDPADFQVSADKVEFDFSGEVKTGLTGTDGFNKSTNHLAGSKHVEFYTNREILRASADVDPFSKGFIDCRAEGFARSSDQQIGGFSITNVSGVTYHYALPAYSFEEYMRSENVESKQEENGLSFNELKKPEKYAYTWFLTAVTGPDFVDRNANGLADHGDWGYWTSFEYKKLYSDYRWRNPGEGMNLDIDGEFQNYAAGKKEIYYLERILTETHIAVFEKSLRKDGREVSDLKIGGFKVPLVVGGINPQCIRECQQSSCPDGNCELAGKYLECLVDRCNANIVTTIRPLMKLDRIKLYNYDTYATGKTSDEFLLREIEFNYDYTLAPGTPNSYDENNKDEDTGKLTLTSLSFNGKKGNSLVPPMTFEYKHAPYGKDKRDIWGFYKKDFDVAYRDQTNEIVARLTTESSAEDVDAWSLNSVTTSLGARIKIEYESDRYHEVVLTTDQILRPKDVTDYGANKLKLTFWESGVDYSQYFRKGNEVDIDLIGTFLDRTATDKTCDCTPVATGAPPPYFFSRVFTGKVVIDEINTSEDYIVVSGSDYYNQLKNETKEFSRTLAVPLNSRTCQEYDRVKCNYTYSGSNAWPDYIASGVLSAPEQPKPGGGLRVKSISLLNEIGDSRQTTYEYETGTTSYEPFRLLAPKIHPDYIDADQRLREVKIQAKRLILNKVYKQIALSRQIPGPGVMYQFVNVRETVTTSAGQTHEIPNYSRYEFEVFQPGMVGLIPDAVRKEKQVNGIYENVDFKKAYMRKVTLKDFSSRVGNLKSITLYNTSNGEPVSKTIHHYLHDGISTFSDNVEKFEPLIASEFLNQGVTEETYSRAKIVLFKAGNKIPYPDGESADIFKAKERNLLALVSKYESFPSVLKGQTTINYKTGMTTTSSNLAFDFYSGEAIKTVSEDSYGNRYVSSTIPAYHHYPKMGLKIYDIGNKNMLTQSAGNTLVTANPDNSPKGLISASVQTWSNELKVLDVPEGQPEVWRKLSSYQWNGQEKLNTDGSFNYNYFQTFDFAKNADNDKWEKVNEATLYDVYSHGLEASDINGNFVSTRMGRNQQRVISSASNASYVEAASSGAEYYAANLDDEGGVDRGEGNPSTVRTHTGHYSLLVGYGSKGFNYTLKSSLNKKYRASVWVYAPGEAETQSDLSSIHLYYTVDGVEKGKTFPVLQKNKSKSWYLLNLDIDPSGGTELFVGVRNDSQRGVYFDDFRVHPLDASLIAYVYDQLSGELNFILDSKNFYTRFEYDDMGRLVRTSREVLNYDFGDGKESFKPDVVLKEVKYNYGQNH